MTKQEEIEAIAAFVESLPDESYSKGFFAAQAPQIAQAISSDFLPELFVMSAIEFDEHREGIARRATYEAKKHIAEAERKAAGIIAAAKNEAERVGDDLRDMLRTIERTVNA